MPLKKVPFGAMKAALGCGVILIFFTGIFGIVLSFFTADAELASAVRTRCFIGLLIGIAMVIAWKIFSPRLR
jgi:uncharacterized membrane protein